MISEDVLSDVVAAFRAEVGCTTWAAWTLFTRHDPSLLSEPECRRAVVFLTRVMERALALHNQEVQPRV